MNPIEENHSPLQNHQNTGENADESPADQLPPSFEKKIIFQNEDAKGKITIFESLDKTKAFLQITCSSLEEKYSKDDILQVIYDLYISSEINAENIEFIISSLKQIGDTVGPVQIAEGIPPINIKDGTYDIFFDPNDPYVEEGNLLIRVSELTHGEEGQDIYGNPIEPAPGIKQQIILGNDFVEEKGNEYFSKVTGKVIFTDNVLSVEKTIFLKVSDDKMEATLTCTTSKKISREEIIDKLKEEGIVYGIDEDAITFIVSSFNNEGTPIKNFPVARGMHAKQGRDGKINFLFDVNNAIHYKERADGSIDIRETHRIQSVSEEVEIAQIIPHIDSIPGKDVYGKTIPVSKIKQANLKADNNVRVSDDGLHFFSEKSGSPTIEGDKISVSDVFSVSGDLNLSIGNIDFDGVVEIAGDVEDGFKVKASKSIHVHGCVGASDIEAGHDIEITGGCNGKEKALLVAGGNIAVKYINEAEIIAKGDIIAVNEIVNCNIKTLGRVILKHGSIRGGTILAKKGIEALNIGSDMGVKTILFPGEDYELKAKCEEIDKTIIEKNNEIEKINTRIAPLVKNKELLQKLTNEQRDALKETILYLKKINEEKNDLNITKNDLISETLQDAVPEVVVYFQIFQGSILKIGTSRREISSMLEGPLRLYEVSDSVSVEPYSEKDARKQPGKPADAEELEEI